MSRSGPSGALPPFEAVVSTHGAAVLRVCRALVGAVDADDVWQETFLAALRAYPASGNIRNKEAWLITIARNKAIDHRRKAQRLPIPTEAVGAPEAGAPDMRGGRRLADEGIADGGRYGAGGSGQGDVVVRSVEAGEAAAKVWAALARLPRTQREAVVYHHLAGLRYALVAELLGNSEPAARRAAADGMQALRMFLAQDQGTGNNDRT